MAPSMRQKAARVRREKDVSDLPQMPAPPPHLQSRESKKEKREIKSRSFRSKLEGDSSKISKSSLRRQKRKAKTNLHGGGLGDLLSTLPEVAEEMNKTTTPFIAKPTKPVNPKSSSRSNEKVVRSEIDRFNKVVTDKSFQAKPFDKLKEFISQNMEKKKEFVDMEAKRNKMEL